MKTLHFGFFALLWILFLASACEKKSSPPRENTDPRRCERIDLGEAADLIHKKDIPSDQLVAISGMADPRALVWRNEQEQKTFYITKVMGTEQRLFYFREIEAGEKPGIATQFKGHLLRWDQLPPARFDSVKNALLKKYNIDVKPKSSYVVLADRKPKGCN